MEKIKRTYIWNSDTFQRVDREMCKNNDHLGLLVQTSRLISFSLRRTYKSHVYEIQLYKYLSQIIRKNVYAFFMMFYLH